jgi:hypothetical protein
MRSRILGRITLGMAGLTGTSGLGLTAFKMTSGRSGIAESCIVITTSFVMTGLVAILGLVLNYRLGKLAVQAQAASAERGDDLRRRRLELQRSVLDKVQEGTEGAQAYLTMATADALYLSAEQRATPTNTTALPGGQASCHAAGDSRATAMPLHVHPS